MRIHHYEKLRLIIGSLILIIFLSILAVQTFFWIRGRRAMHRPLIRKASGNWNFFQMPI